MNPAGYLCTLCHRPAKDPVCMDNCTAECESTEHTPKAPLFTEETIVDVARFLLTANGIHLNNVEKAVAAFLRPPPPLRPVTEVIKALRNGDV